MLRSDKSSDRFLLHAAVHKSNKLNMHAFHASHLLSVFFCKRQSHFPLWKDKNVATIAFVVYGQHLNKTVTVKFTLTSNLSRSRTRITVLITPANRTVLLSVARRPDPIRMIGLATLGRCFKPFVEIATI